MCTEGYFTSGKIARLVDHQKNRARCPWVRAMWNILIPGTALALAASSAFAAAPCNTRDSVLERLAEKYFEAPIAVGVTNTGALIEVLATEDGDTWTIIITTPQGVSCLIAAGEGWRTIEQVAIDPNV